jgi:hypothetical protein
MIDSGPGTNISIGGDWGGAAKALIEKISDAIGGWYRPHHIRQIAEAKGDEKRILAEADADAERIRALSQIEIDELQRRAMCRWVGEETKKQVNIESITVKALPHVDEDAPTGEVEEDWIVAFFDKCRLISDEEMQQLWARILAGEANFPGKYSKRTLALLSSLDKGDAILFQKLCSFGWIIADVVPLIFDVEDPIYNGHGIHFNVLRHLDTLGLIDFVGLTGFNHLTPQKEITVYYYGSPVRLEFYESTRRKTGDYELDIGLVMLSEAGQQLATICEPVPVPGFLEYVAEKWKSHGYVVELQDTPPKTGE